MMMALKGLLHTLMTRKNLCNTNVVNKSKSQTHFLMQLPLIGRAELFPAWSVISQASSACLPVQLFSCSFPRAAAGFRCYFPAFFFSHSMAIPQKGVGFLSKESRHFKHSDLK